LFPALVKAQIPLRRLKIADVDREISRTLSQNLRIGIWA